MLTSQTKQSREFRWKWSTQGLYSSTFTPPPSSFDLCIWIQCNTHVLFVHTVVMISADLVGWMKQLRYNEFSHDIFVNKVLIMKSLFKCVNLQFSAVTHIYLLWRRGMSKIDTPDVAQQRHAGQARNEYPLPLPSVLKVGCWTCQ